MKKFTKNSMITGLATSAISLALGLAGVNVAFAATSPTLTDALSYSVLGASTVTCTGATTVSGNVGVSPGTAITGFPSDPGPCTFSGAGAEHSNDASAIAAQADNLSAFGALDAGTNADANCVGGIYPSGTDLSTLSPLGPGLYCSAGTFLLTGNLTLTGTTGTWVFKTVSGLTTSPGSSVTGGDACNTWWRVGSSAILDTTTTFRGNILALTNISVLTGASLNGRAMAQTAAVTLDANAITGPVCTVLAPPSGSSSEGRVNVVKTVVNDNGGSKVVSDFPLFVGGIPVVSGETNYFSEPPNDTYVVTETTDPNYTRTFSGDCDIDGHMTYNSSYTRFCIITNNDIGAPAVPIVPPLIDVVKTPSPLALPGGPGLVKYTYKLSNTGTVPVSDITMVGDTCSPIVLISGDMNSNDKLDVNEMWTYTCSTNLTETHTNTVVATGWANGISAVDIASATVVVGAPIIPPLIHVTKVPSPLVLDAGGGVVTYTEKITNPGTVALSNVVLTDDKCSPVQFVSGDTNSDDKLDASEVWTYTCQTNLTQTTTNTASASGEANGITVREIAVATVVVPELRPAAPGLPNTGVAPTENISWNIVIPAAIFMGLILLAVTRRKQKN